MKLMKLESVITNVIYLLVNIRAENVNPYFHPPEWTTNYLVSSERLPDINQPAKKAWEEKQAPWDS